MSTRFFKKIIIRDQHEFTKSPSSWQVVFCHTGMRTRDADGHFLYPDAMKQWMSHMMSAGDLDAELKEYKELHGGGGGGAK